jgi:hypothetical protein
MSEQSDIARTVSNAVQELGGALTAVSNLYTALLARAEARCEAAEQAHQALSEAFSKLLKEKEAIELVNASRANAPKSEVDLTSLVKPRHELVHLVVREVVDRDQGRAYVVTACGSSFSFNELMDPNSEPTSLTKIKEKTTCRDCLGTRQST